MPSLTNISTVVSSCSVIALFIETILQTYVSVSDNDGPSIKPSVAVSLCCIGVAFLSTSIASFLLANSSSLFHKDNDHYLKSKLIFKVLHVFQFGLLWRIFKMITSFTGSDAKLLVDLRTVHVAIQSLPYIVLYSSTFLIRGKITAIQGLSLAVSVISAASAVTCYNLRLKLFTDEAQQDETGSLKSLSQFKSTCAVLATFFGTLLVLFSRIASLVLMAAQVRLWVLIPLSLHFAIILLILIIFSSRNDKLTSKIVRIFRHVIYCLGMACLNSFDLVYDNISHVMCKYVAFYSLLLIENIIFITFWLLNFDFDYVSKLVTVLGILSAFIVGLVIKFAGCTFSQWDSKPCPSDEDSSHGTLGLPSITTTVASTTLSLVHPAPLNKDDDLISIVQASLALHSQRDELNGGPINLEHSSSSNQLLQLRVASTKRSSQPRFLGRNSNGHKAKLKSQTKSIDNERKLSARQNSKIPPSVGYGLEDSTVTVTPSFHKSSITTHRQHSKHERSRLSSNNSNTPDQNESFQHSSVLSVSDPETLLSDMMYDTLLGEAACCQIVTPDESTPHRNVIKKTKPRKDVVGKRRTLSESQCSHEFTHPERIRTIHNVNVNHPAFQLPHKSATVGKSSSSKFINTTPGGKSFVENRTHDRPHLNINLNRNENRYGESSNQNNESSDNAVSSAKTYPRNSKFDREMKNILSSIAATGGQDDQTTSAFNPSIPHYRFSDSETVVKTNNKPGRLHSSSGQGTKIYKNIITYAEPDDINIGSTTTTVTSTIPHANLRHNTNNANPRARTVSSSSNKLAADAKGDKNNIHVREKGHPSHNAHNANIPAQSRVTTSTNVIQLCESGSSSFTTTVTNGNLTHTSSTSTMATEDCWHDDCGMSNGVKSDRLSQYLRQSDTDRISPSENILRWLATTEAPDIETV